MKRLEIDLTKPGLDLSLSSVKYDPVVAPSPPSKENPSLNASYENKLTNMIEKS